MATTQWNPMGDRVLVRLDEALTRTDSGLFLPNTAQEQPQTGVVLAVGPGKRKEDGSYAPVALKEGMRVLIGKYSGTKITAGTEEILCIREEDVLAVAQ